MSTILFPTIELPRIVTPISPGRIRASVSTGVLAMCCVFAAMPAQAAKRGAATPAVADFRGLSGSFPASCSTPLDVALSGMGEPALRRCAWSQHLELLYWQSVPDVPNSCLPTPAIAWHRLGATAGATLPPWNGSWAGQSLFAQNSALHHAGAVWRQPDGQWSAALWRWRPSSRLATREWQAGHWNTILQGVRSAGTVGVPVADRAGPANAAASAPTWQSPLMSAWLEASRGKPRMVEPDAWRWVADRACLSMRSAGIGQSQLHLPYSRDDARLEQRSAMQVQLVRRYPAAEWLQPFTLIEPAAPGARSGAKFLALWKEGKTVHGQLWITMRDEGGILRARISSDVPVNAAAGGAGAETVKQRAALIERELTALAHAWEAHHE
ncbi:hypothetical protein [Massilia consociata]|uniref:Uncharacterized protein n=1 Tax=Massilia consociata TaxID=760117 RepID=A0ABV6FEY3_9BURK